MAGYSVWGRKELDTTEATNTHAWWKHEFPQSCFGLGGSVCWEFFPLASFQSFLLTIMSVQWHWTAYCFFFFFWIFFSFFFLIFISWRLITLQHCSGFCHTLKWISHGFTCVPHPNPPSHLPLHPIPLDLPSAPALSTCLMHPTWAGDLFHPR